MNGGGLCLENAIRTICSSFRLKSIHAKMWLLAHSFNVLNRESLVFLGLGLKFTEDAVHEGRDFERLGSQRAEELRTQLSERQQSGPHDSGFRKDKVCRNGGGERVEKLWEVGCLCRLKVT